MPDSAASVSTLEVQHKIASVDGQQSGGRGTSAYVPELDSLRFFAFALVYLHHHTFHVTERLRPIETAREACGFGLCIFFTLSSYLITNLLLREQAITDGIHLRAFYLRRILRIWPLYIGFILISYVIGIVSPKHAAEPLRILAMLLLAGNWYAVFHGYGSQSPVSPLWSISVEEQFYLIWPTVARYGRRVILWGAISTVVLSLISTYEITRLAWGGQGALWANSLVQFLFFGTGALLAWAFHGRNYRKDAVRAWVLVTCGVTGAWMTENAFHLKTEGMSRPNPFGITAGYLLVSVMCSLVLLGFRAFPRMPRPFTYLGKVSYGLYVFHNLSMLLMTELGALFHVKLLGSALGPLLTLTLASLSYEYYEKPFLRLKQRFTFVHSRPE
jgi:peptidoglycan/LPS O-acetylase OafA/YrhL